jgi:3-hydroxyisobutyrate dehydrogenase
MKIAFIGLGAMGFPMARHLAREHEVLVWNRTREKAERHAREHHTRLLGDLAEAAVVGAENATLTIMMGGTAENVERARQILRLNGKTLIHVGEAGAGHAIKVLTNTIMGATVWITAECMLLAKELGIDIKTALEVTNAGSGRSNASENLLPLRLRDHKWPLVFKLAHHDKDIRIAASLAHQQHASTPMLALTQQLFTAALHQLGEGADYIEVAKIVARMNGKSWD